LNGGAPECPLNRRIALRRHLSLSVFALAFMGSALAGAANAPKILFEGEGERRAALDAMQGLPAPALHVENWMNTDARSLEDLKGKVVLLDFWGVWCAPCIRAVPDLNALQKKYADDGLVVLGVHTTDRAEDMASFVKERSVQYAVAADVGNATTNEYFVDSYPDVYLIDHEGRLRFADIVNLRHDNIEAAVQTLLAERESSMSGS
jgi:thiol-disulfide isomerase/thioredoxin